MRWEEFKPKAVPEEIRRREGQKNVFVPLSRWVAVREAFVLHHLGVTGNMVSLFRVVLAVVALFLYSRFVVGDMSHVIAGIVLMAWQLNLDGVDGALARVQDRVSDFGNALDNLGIDFARSAFWALAGAMTGDMGMVILTVLAGYILVPFRQNCGGHVAGRFDDLVRYFIYIPVLWVIVPSVMLLLRALSVPAVTVAYGVAWWYFGLAVSWFVVCLWTNLVQTRR